MSIKPGSIIEATIERIGTQGDGVTSFEGLSLIVPKTTAGDKISCEVKYSTKDRIHADLIEILEPGNNRIIPPCQYYKSCGGCGLQHISAAEYKNYKLELLTKSLKYSSISLPDLVAWFSVGEASRRRAFVRFDKSGKLGFYEHQSHNVIDINKCLILEPALEVLLLPLKELSGKLDINIEGWMITNTDSGLDITLQSEDDRKLKNESAVLGLLQNFAKSNKIIRLSWKRGNKITPVITITKPFLKIGGREIILPQEYFIQASKTGAEAILNAVIPAVDRGAKVLDLFSGVGVYSFALADIAGHISAYEIAPEMIKSMQVNIASNNLKDKISAHCRDIDKLPLSRAELSKYDTAIINPPRTGALKQVATLALAGIAKIIMVSCNSQTFTRDAKILHENGYKLKSLSAIDQFYYSHHLEQVGVFGRV